MYGSYLSINIASQDFHLPSANASIRVVYEPHWEVMFGWNQLINLIRNCWVLNHPSRENFSSASCNYLFGHLDIFHADI